MKYYVFLQNDFYSKTLFPAANKTTRHQSILNTADVGSFTLIY